MKSRFALLFPMLAALAFSGCKKDNEMDTPASTVAELRSALATPAEAFTISNLHIAGNSFTTATGIQFYFPQNCLVDLAGNVITTPVEFQVKSMLSAKDMILNNCPTQGPDGLFISGGEFSISATSMGQAVKIDPSAGKLWVTVPTRITETSRDSTFLVWKGTPTSAGTNTSVTWGPPDTIIYDTVTNNNNTFVFNSSVTDNWGSTSPTSSTIIHRLFLTSFNWINLDIYYPVALPKTGIEIKVPTGFTNANSTCYLVIRSGNSVAGLYDFNVGTKRFNLGGYQVPVGLQAIAVVISKVGDTYKYGQTVFTVTENAVIEVSPENATLDEIKTKLGFL